MQCEESRCDTKGSFPQNGYALITDLHQPNLLKILSKVKGLEKDANFEVTKYWNRRWEYPFLIQTSEKVGGEILLDAGAGRSLLPIYLSRSASKVVALDLDNGSFYPKGSLPDWYINTQKLVGGQVEFTEGDICYMRYDDESFDTVYSMSVIEHVHDPIRAVKELWRVLKTTGVFAITIDVSLDGRRELTERSLDNIIAFLNSEGTPIYQNRSDRTQYLLSTDWFRNNEPEALPWIPRKRSTKERLEALSRRDWKSISSWEKGFFSMGVVGLAFRKGKPEYGTK